MGKYLIEMPLNKVLNPTWKNYEWVDVGMGISKPLQFDARPSTWGQYLALLLRKQPLRVDQRLKTLSQKRFNKMKRELFILAYVVIMGAIIVSTVSFWDSWLFLVNEMNSGNENIPYKELLYVSFKVGITGGVIGGVGTWLMNHFSSQRRK